MHTTTTLPPKPLVLTVATDLSELISLRDKNNAYKAHIHKDSGLIMIKCHTPYFDKLRGE